jgi:hypothetical protein
LVDSILEKLPQDIVGRLDGAPKEVEKENKGVSANDNAVIEEEKKDNHELLVQTDAPVEPVGAIDNDGKVDGMVSDEPKLNGKAEEPQVIVTSLDEISELELPLD